MTGDNQLSANLSSDWSLRVEHNLPIRDSGNRVMLNNSFHCYQSFFSSARGPNR